MRVGLLTMVLVLFFGSGRGQCPTAGFTAPSAVCQGESIYVQNNSSGATSYQWDFCSGDLASAPTSMVAASSPTIFRARTFRMVQSSGSWFGFAIDQNYFLVRFKFGNSPANIPSVTPLGNLGLIQSALDLRFWQEGSDWFALVANTSNNNLLLLSFGTDLESTPAVSDLGTLGGIFKGPAGLDIFTEGNHIFAIVTNSSAAEAVLLDFGNSLSNTPTPSVITLAGASSLRGVSINRECNRWFALVTDNGGNKIYYIDFDTGIQNLPTTGLLSIPGASFSSPSGISLVKEGGDYFAFIQSVFPSDVYRLDFGASIIDQTATYTNLGNFNINSAPANAQFNGALEMISNGTVWTGYSIDLSGPGGIGNLTMLNFPGLCSAGPDSGSSSPSPIITYGSAGTYRISLTATASDGTSSQLSKVINVSAGVAPVIDFSSQNNCAGSAVNFTESNLSGNITSRSWAFGDGQVSSAFNPANTYAAPGTYQVSLSITASNGCNNFISKGVTVYNAPVADFNPPSAAPVCTNQNYLLTNTSSFDSGSSPAWEWRLNGTLVSAQQDFTVQFGSPVSQELRLKATIPGCSNEMIKTIAAVKTGPVVSFSANDNCQGTAVLFANETTGADAGYVWNFGDGNTSTSTNPSHPYATSSTFQATLVASNAQGCQNFLTKPVRIYSLPVPDFSVGLPPFSCANALTPFQNTTPPLTDSNITSWNWQFNDPAAGTSSQQSPSYTFATSGSFNVGLTAISDAGCSASTTRSVTISPSPSAEFTSGPSCLNQSTKFTDLSSGGVQSRLWQIGTSTFTTANPSYTFVTPGNFPVTLSVTGPNACSNVNTKTIAVPVSPALDFSVNNPCAGQNATFTDATSSPQDAIVGWNWNFAGDAGTGNPAEFNFSPSGVFNVKMTTTHASGCRYTLSRNIQVNPSPVASFTASPDRGEAPLIVQFVSTPQPSASYSWKFFDMTVSASTSSAPVHTFATLGDYSAELTVTNALGCADVRSLPIQVLIPSIDLIMKDFTLVSDPVTGKLKSSVTILNNSNIPVSSAEVALFLSEKAVVNETVSLNLSPGQTAARTLSFTLSPDQFDFSFLCAEILSEKDVQADNNKRCINLESEDYFISPYPNPTSGEVHLDWIAPRAGDPALIIIYDGMGKKSYEWQTTSEAGLNQTIHDVTFLAAGLYYVTIETGGSRKTTRFLRQ